jgi:hypothetical protein
MTRAEASFLVVRIVTSWKRGANGLLLHLRHLGIGERASRGQALGGCLLCLHGKACVTHQPSPMSSIPPGYSMTGPRCGATISRAHSPTLMLLVSEPTRIVMVSPQLATLAGPLR